MDTNKYCNDTDLEILEKEFLDISDKRIIEYDISKVRGSVRLHTAEIITVNEVAKMKKKIKSLKFPSKKK